MQPATLVDLSKARFLSSEFVGTAAYNGCGDNDYLCYKCGLVLLERIVDSEISDIYVHCGRCGSLNYKE
jgi:DNA-directed RNA polymerase subunit RPC12/RpoP